MREPGEDQDRLGWLSLSFHPLWITGVGLCGGLGNMDGLWHAAILASHQAHSKEERKVGRQIERQNERPDKREGEYKKARKENEL